MSQVTNVRQACSMALQLRPDIEPVGDVAGDDAAWYVRGRLQLPAGHSGGPSPTTPTRRGCSRAQTPGSRVPRGDGSTRRMDRPVDWVFNPCLENERVENGVCAPCTGGGTRAAGDDPAAGDTGCTFPANSAALKAAVDNCLAVDPTGVACCSHGADCGAAGTVEMPDWDVSLVTDMSSLFNGKASFNADISRWARRASRPCHGCSSAGVQQISFMGHLERHKMGDVRCPRSTSTYRDGTSARSRHEEMFYDANAFNTMPVGWDTSKVTNSTIIFIRATAWNARFTGGDDTPSPAVGRASTTRATRLFRPSTAPSAPAPTPS